MGRSFKARKGVRLQLIEDRREQFVLSGDFDAHNGSESNLNALVPFDFSDSNWIKKLKKYLSMLYPTDSLLYINGVTTDSIELAETQIDKLGIKARRSFEPSDQTFIIKLLSEGHQKLLLHLIGFLRRQLRLHGGIDEYCRLKRSCPTKIGDEGGYKQLDESVLPLHAAIATALGKRRRCPQTAFEVGFAELLGKLEEDMLE